MIASQVYKGSTVKIVTVLDIGGESDVEIADFAIAAAHETRGSLFGTHVKRYANKVADTATVSLYTD